MLKHHFLWTALFLFLSSSACTADALPYAASTMVDLETIIISAVRSAVAGGRSAENITVYSTQKIQTLPVRNLGDVLSYVPGVDVQIGSHLGQASALSIHGSTPREVRVMVDDIPFNTQISGQANPARIPVENIERVEIIKGPSSSAWGSGLGGVVNVITKDTGTTAVPQGSVTNSFGEFATRKHSVDLAGKAGDVGYYVMDSYMKTDGVRGRSGVTDEKSFGKLSLPVGDQGKVTGSFGYSGGDVGFEDMLTERFYRMPYISRYGKLSLELDKPDFDFSVAYKYHDQLAGQDKYNAVTLEPMSSIRNNNVYHGLSFNGSARVREEDIFVVGTDLEWDTIKSSSYLETARDIAMQAPYANYTWRLGHWDVVPGVRFDNNNRFGNQLSPSLGTIYHFQDAGDTRWKAKVSRAFNAPPLMWIFNNDPSVGVAPNLDLKAERAMVYETGIATHIGRVGMSLDLYRNDVKDGLTLVCNEDYSLCWQDNVERLRRQGAEAQIQYAITDGLSTYVTGEYNSNVNRTTGEAVRDNGMTVHGFRWGWNFKHAGWEIDLSGHYARMDSSPDQAHDRRPIFDSRFIRRWPHAFRKIDLETFLNIRNLTNTPYWADPSLPIAPRYFESGVTVQF